LTKLEELDINATDINSGLEYIYPPGIYFTLLLAIKVEKEPE
jgi:hypothetical protein